MIIIDGEALVNIIKSAMSEPFDDYAFMYTEHIRSQFVDSACRVDIVIDVMGIRRRVEGRKRSLQTS